MLSFLNKIKSIFSNKIYDAEIIGDIKFHHDGTPYFIVKMHGCQTLVDIHSEDIVEKFYYKFSQQDVKKATKAFMKYRKLLRLAIIEKNFAILHNKQEDSYQLVDLSDNLLLRNIDINEMRPEDAFKLGIHFERMRIEKDRKLFNLRKVVNNVSYLKVVSQNE